jgi:anti-sigma factor RsiW
MNNAEFEKWLETVRRRPLAAPEQSQLEQFLSRHPELRQIWDQEDALTRLLVQLPEPPLSNNFTAKVLKATARSAPRPGRAFPFLDWLRLPRPALGFAAALITLTAVIIGLLLHQDRAQAQMAHSVADLSWKIELAASATDLPPVQFLQDFEAIYRLDAPQPLADEELLAALE